MWLLLLIIFIMQYETNPYLYISDTFLVFQDFTVIKALGLVGFGWAMARMATGVSPGVTASRQARLFMLLFAGVVLSSAVNGTGFVIVSKYLAFLFFLPFVLVTVRTHEDLRRVVYALVLSYALIFPYALRQMRTYDTRLGGGLYEPNYLAAGLVLVLPVALAIALAERRPGRRRLWFGAAAVIGLEIVLTSSRGGFLGLLAALLTFVYKRRGLAAAVGVLAVLVAVVVTVPTTLGERALATLTGDAQDAPPGLEQSNRAHTALFWAGLRMIADAPLIGVGPFNFKALSGYYSGLDVNFIAHNTYLEIAAEVGVPVFIVFLGILVTTFGTLSRATRLGGTPAARELATWAGGFRAGLVGFCVAGAFISAEYEKILWITVFLSIVIGRLTAHYEREPEAQTAIAGPPLTSPPILWTPAS